ncbi:MarR family winged helix-turn-helix transcriptional regulator [Citricoccus sp. GCM10030269]|uniref:MarR family winged helix-turn-helix transcriptional regulator n=1 Tax=Citricoccus sp. GCM10030269 TaxID=3273388 RepID=UPI0036088D47
MTTPLDSPTLGARLAEVYLLVGPVYRKASKIVQQQQAGMKMSMGVRAVLEQLQREGDVTVPRIAASQELSRQFVQRMVHEAHEAGYVELVENPRHRRSSLVRLTPGGRAAIEAVIHREHSLLGNMPGELTHEDIETTLHVLRSMLRGMEDVEAAME